MKPYLTLSHKRDYHTSAGQTTKPPTEGWKKKEKAAKERGFTTCRLHELAAFQKNFPVSTTFHDGSMDFGEYIEGRLADVYVPRGRWGSGVSWAALIKTGGDRGSKLVYNLSIWKAKPETMTWENVLDGGGDGVGGV